MAYENKLTRNRRDEKPSPQKEKSGNILPLSSQGFVGVLKPMLLGLFILSEVPVSDMDMTLRSGHGYDTPILQIYGKTYKN